ncbi:PLP-dependent aminotransferase family protein [Ralstonia insidiosa]|uniref:aminotransferase-like domain-containing protein n=1 Tax=Ralstonia insidiosa TaxID=190721 RepID=UPI000CEE31C0|nr:PLP-dependent aminotransferase family protein [Ralstonia insidiosa]
MTVTELTLPPTQPAQPLYRMLADHYLGAIRSGVLMPGERMPSVRALMRTHGVSLSTALQVCRHLEADGWLEARERSGYFVRQPRRALLAPVKEPELATPDPAAYVGVHARVSAIVARGQQANVRVDLSGASGAPALYPAAALNRITTQVLRRHPFLLTQAVMPNGHPEFQIAVARRALDMGMQIAPDDVVVTHGCIEAVNLALRAVAQPGDTVAVESPTYYGLLQVLESLGMRAVEIPTSPRTGMSLEALEMAVQAYDNIRAVVVVPNLQNPLGSIMPDAAKRRMVAFCEQHNIALIEDDTYSPLADSNTPLKAIKAWDRTGNVIYCASLSKTVAPGLRLGWMTAGRWQGRVQMLKFAQSRPNDSLLQVVAGRFIASGAYDRHIRTLRQTLREQRERMAESIAECFPAGTRLSVPSGGLAMWVELPTNVSSVALFDAALKHSIRIAPGTMFSNLNRFDHFFRICFGLAPSANLETALATLGELTRQLTEA